jgi:hypothetical protein
MAYTKFKIEVPQTNKHYTNTDGANDFIKPHIVEGHKKMINRVESTYKTSIQKWAKEFDIDEGVIISFICTESGGINLAGKKTTSPHGLMQVTPNTIFEVYTKWSVAVDVPLSAETKKFFESKVSTTKSWVRDKISPPITEQISNALRDADYNIASGTASIRWMLEAYANIGVTGIDKVMVSYNAGYYGTRNKIKNMSINQIVKDVSLPSESRAYVLKMLGVKGFMDLYYNILEK